MNKHAVFGAYIAKLAEATDLGFGATGTSRSIAPGAAKDGPPPTTGAIGSDANIGVRTSGPRAPSQYSAIRIGGEQGQPSPGSSWVGANYGIQNALNTSRARGTPFENPHPGLLNPVIGTEPHRARFNANQRIYGNNNLNRANNFNPTLRAYGLGNNQWSLDNRPDHIWNYAGWPTAWGHRGNTNALNISTANQQGPTLHPEENTNDLLNQRIGGSR